MLKCISVRYVAYTGQGGCAIFPAYKNVNEQIEFPHTVSTVY